MSLYYIVGEQQAAAAVDLELQKAKWQDESRRAKDAAELKHVNELTQEREAHKAELNALRSEHTALVSKPKNV